MLNLRKFLDLDRMRFETWNLKDGQCLKKLLGHCPIF